jgi:cytochrome P450
MTPVVPPDVPAFANAYQRVSSFAEIMEIMKHPDFAMGGAEERRIFLGDTIILAEGEDHKQQKNLFAQLMSRDAMAYYELRLLEPVITGVIEDLKAGRSDDGLVRADVCRVVSMALTRIAAQVTGVDGVDTPAQTERFLSRVLILSEATTGSFSGKPVDVLIQQGKDALKDLVDEFLKSSLERRIDLVRRHRAGEIAATELPRDMLTTLCLKDDLARPDDGTRIPYIWRQSALFLTAAIKTTSHSLPHIFVHLDEWVREHPEDRAKLTDPDFLHRAAAESLRLHQTAPVRFRTALRDVALSTGRKVAKDEMIALRVPPANLEDGVFGAHGDRFNPYREAPVGVQPWGMTFGVGIHACLGRNLVTGMKNAGDQKYGTHGTIVRIVKALYDLGAEFDPSDPPARPVGSFHDTYERMPVILRRA